MSNTVKFAPLGAIDFYTERRVAPLLLLAGQQAKPATRPKCFYTMLLAQGFTPSRVRLGGTEYHGCGYDVTHGIATINQPNIQVLYAWYRPASLEGLESHVACKVLSGELLLLPIADALLTPRAVPIRRPRGASPVDVWGDYCRATYERDPVAIGDPSTRPKMENPELN